MMEEVVVVGNVLRGTACEGDLEGVPETLYVITFQSDSIDPTFVGELPIARRLSEVVTYHE